MTTTVEQIVRDIESTSPSGIGGVAIAKWLNNRYQELVSKMRFRHLRKVGELSLPGIVETGTISATRGSTTVTGDSTTFVTEVGSGAQTDYYFRGRSAWYKIASIAGETSLTLSSAFAEDDISEASYAIVKRTHSLASDCRWLGTVLHPRRKYELLRCSLDELEIYAPGRYAVGNDPSHVAQIGSDASGYMQVEVYPPPQETELLQYVYWALPTDLTLSSTLPQVIDSYVLKEGTLIDVYRKAKINSIELGNIDAAAVWSNEEQKQTTRWRKYIQDALRTQTGSDDITFILKHFGGIRSGGEIRTARDQVYADWSG